MLRLTTFTAALALVCGSAFANDCTMAVEMPVMPDPETATSEDRSGAITQIKAYQGALGEYRACLEAIFDDVDLEGDARQAALDAFNATVDDETAMVDAWQKFNEAFEANNG